MDLEQLLELAEKQCERQETASYFDYHRIPNQTLHMVEFRGEEIPAALRTLLTKDTVELRTLNFEGEVHIKTVVGGWYRKNL